MTSSLGLSPRNSLLASVNIARNQVDAAARGAGLARALQPSKQVLELPQLANSRSDFARCCEGLAQLSTSSSQSLDREDAFSVQPVLHRPFHMQLHISPDATEVLDLALQMPHALLLLAVRVVDVQAGVSALCDIDLRRQQLFSRALQSGGQLVPCPRPVLLERL
eukprot:1165525-Rhodomonas_salina.3